MTSSCYKIYGLAVHTKMQRCRFQIYTLWDPVSKIALSGSQNAGSVWTKRRYVTKYLRIQLNASPSVWGLTVIVFYMTV